MPQQKPFNLFVYGTLMNPSVFRAVLGRRMVLAASDADGAESFLVRDAVLDGWKKISPDHTYLYAVPDTFGRIRGYVVGPLPPECMKSLLRYEGRNYSRKSVNIQTQQGMQKATVFVANRKQLEHSFGYEFHDPFKQEVLLRQKIEAALLEAQREQFKTDGDDAITRRAIGELHGDTIRDLIRVHFDAGGISDYAIRHSLKDAPLRNYDRVRNDPEATALAENYLAMVIRQVIFNQFEEQIRRDFRYELDRMSQDPGYYYDHTISALAALSILNAGEKFLNLLVGDSLTDLKFPRDRLIDFVKWAIVAADAIYNPKIVKRRLMEIRSHMAPGEIPLGTELEFSNIGHSVIRDPEGKQARDAKYDGFLYFADFGLDILTWRLGGHIDDHRDKASTRPRRGFFEIALGNLSIGENISKPITNDPWILGQIIHEARRFYDIAPHSMHISMQLRSGHRQMPDRTLPLSVLKCLFALGGDADLDAAGRLRIHRLVGEEIIGHDPNPHLLFSDIRKRFSRTEEANSSRRPTGQYVQQFRFLRLSSKINYEPLIMGLKGIQLALSPGNFLTSLQYENSPKHRQLYEDLLAWGIAPTPISRPDIETFLGHVYEGLMNERRHKPAHSPSYIAWSVNQLRQTLARFNELAKTNE